jgi:hypothetical protein
MPIACPHCAKPVEDEDALLCFYCGGSLHRATGFLGFLKYGHRKFLTLVILVLVIVLFVLLQIF